VAAAASWFGWRAARHWLLVLVTAATLVTISGCATAIDPRLDARIEAEVKARLVAEKDANLTQLGVTSERAVVYLSGSVESSDQKARAEELAKSVPGVKRVVNRLGID